MKPIVYLILLVLCLALANRDPALFADGENYAEYVDLVLAGADVNAEPSFRWIVGLVDTLGLGLGGIFFVYLILGYFLKGLYFFVKMPGLGWVSLIYFSSYFVLHDLVQIRVGAALGLGLWAVHYLGERRHALAAVLWFAAFLLHYSAAVLAVLSFFIYAVDSGKVRGLGTVQLSHAMLLMTALLFVWVFLLGSPFSEILRVLLDRYALLPKRYVENYLEPGDVIGLGKMAYVLVLAAVAAYALHRQLLGNFLARHAALCMIAASAVVLAFTDMPVIGARVADMLLFFSPLMVAGLYLSQPAWGQILLFSMVSIQIINLAFFSMVIFL